MKRISHQLLNRGIFRERVQKNFLPYPFYFQARNFVKKMSIVPIINVEALVNPDATHDEKLKCARELGKACEDIGFIILVGHQVPPHVIDNMWKATHSFFDLP